MINKYERKYCSKQKEERLGIIDQKVIWRVKEIRDNLENYCSKLEYDKEGKEICIIDEKKEECPFVEIGEIASIEETRAYSKAKFADLQA